MIEALGIANADGNAAAVTILLRVTVLLSAAMLAATALRRSSAATLHLVWALSLIGTLLIPPLAWAFPKWDWAILPTRQESASVLLVRSLESEAETLIPVAATQAATAGQPSAEPSSSLPGRTGANGVSVARTATPLAWSWRAVLTATWALGTFLGVAWLAIGLMAAWYITRRAKPAPDSDWHQILQRLVASYEIRPVEIRQCAHVSVPMTWGLRRPVILVPASSAAWSEETKRTVLLHELGHIRRRDCLMHLLGRLACAVYWFHPLVWLVARQLRKTSERAADDAVLLASVSAPDYAQDLVTIAGQLNARHALGLVALPMASSSDLEGRVRAILDPRRKHRNLKRETCYGLILVATLLVIPCSLLRLGSAETRHAPTSPIDTQEGAHVLAGRAVNAYGEPVRGATVAFDYGGIAARFQTKTDSEGFYHVVSNSMPPKYVRVEAKGYASLRQRLGNRNPVLRLEKARTLRAQVVDINGSPIAGADVSTSAHPHDIPFFRTVTDQQGRFVWQNAPSCQIPFSIYAQGNWMIKNLAIQASDREQSVTLFPGHSVRGTVMDAHTGKPVTDFRFFSGGFSERSKDWVFQQWDGCVTGNTFLTRNNQPFEQREAIKIEADGYETVIREFDHGPGEKRLDIRLKRASQPSTEAETHTDVDDVKAL